MHGGMGFVEETGAAQYLRDARITTIYEGTTGIQANDLVGRKVAYEKGATVKVADRADARLRRANSAGSAPSRARRASGDRWRRASAALAEATDWLLETYPYNIKAARPGAVPFLKLFGTVAGGWQMARAALIAKTRLDEDSRGLRFLSRQNRYGAVLRRAYPAPGPGLQAGDRAWLEQRTGAGGSPVLTA